MGPAIIWLQISAYINKKVLWFPHMLYHRFKSLPHVNIFLPKHSSSYYTMTVIYIVNHYQCLASEIQQLHACEHKIWVSALRFLLPCMIANRWNPSLSCSTNEPLLGVECKIGQVLTHAYWVIHDKCRKLRICQRVWSCAAL